MPENLQKGGMGVTLLGRKKKKQKKRKRGQIYFLNK